MENSYLHRLHSNKENIFIIHNEQKINSTFQTPLLYYEIIFNPFFSWFGGGGGGGGRGRVWGSEILKNLNGLYHFNVILLFKLCLLRHLDHIFLNSCNLPHSRKNEWGRLIFMMLVIQRLSFALVSLIFLWFKVIHPQLHKLLVLLTTKLPQNNLLEAQSADVTDKRI